MEEQVNHLSSNDDESSPGSEPASTSSLASISSTATVKDSDTQTGLISPIQPEPNVSSSKQCQPHQLVTNSSLVAYLDGQPSAISASASDDAASTSTGSSSTATTANLLASSNPSELPLHLEQPFVHYQYLSCLQESYDNAYVAQYPGQIPVNFMPALLPQSIAQPLPGITMAPPAISALPPCPLTFGVINVEPQQVPCNTTTASQIQSPPPPPQQQKVSQPQKSKRPMKIQPPPSGWKATQPMPPLPQKPRRGGGKHIFGHGCPPTVVDPSLGPIQHGLEPNPPAPNQPGDNDIVNGKKCKKPLTPAQEQRIRDRAIRARIGANFRAFLQNTKLTTNGLLRSPQEARFLTDHICSFMNYLARRLADPEVTYLDLADKRHDDFAFYDDRLMEAIHRLQLLPQATVDKYERLLDHYRSLHPPSLWKFRVKLMQIYEACVEMKELPVEARSQLDYRMVTYEQVDPLILFKSILKRNNSVEQLQFFIREIGLSKEGIANLDRFVTTLKTALETSPLAQLGVKVHPFGSLSNGLGTYDSDLDIVLQFKKVISVNDRLDYETCLLLLKIIRILLPKKLDFCRRLPKNCIVPSKRCPIIKLDFKACCPDLKQWLRNGGGGNRGERTHDGPPRPLCFNKCDISVTSIYGLYNSKVLKFFTSYDRRFYEMSLLLKFWAKHNALITTEGFSSYAFVMCIIYFLQTRQPSILPPIELLQQLARSNAAKYHPVRVHQWRFEFCDDERLVRLTHGASVNKLTTAELIVEFFRFYYKFDYAHYAISTRRGVPTTKEALYREKTQQGLEYAFKSTLIVIEDPFVLEHNTGSIFHEHYMPKWLKTLNNLLNIWRINETNVIKMLTDPTRWDTKPPPRPPRPPRENKS